MDGKGGSVFEVTVSLLVVAVAAWLVVAVSMEGGSDSRALRALRSPRTWRSLVSVRFGAWLGTVVHTLSALPRPQFRPKAPPFPRGARHGRAALPRTLSGPREDAAWLTRGAPVRERPEAKISAALQLVLLITLLGVIIGGLLAAVVWKSFGGLLGAA